MAVLSLLWLLYMFQRGDFGGKLLETWLKLEIHGSLESFYQAVSCQSLQTFVGNIWSY